MKKITFQTFALLICLMGTSSFGQGVGETKSDANVNQQETIFSFKNEIGLTDDQETKLKALLYDEQTTIDTNNNKLKNLGTELSDMIEKKEDMQVIKSKLEEMAKIQVNVSYLNIEDSRKVETILSPDQIEKWRDIQKKFISQSK